jgi:Domain of unknown function (DUF4397)
VKRVVGHAVAAFALAACSGSSPSTSPPPDASRDAQHDVATMRDGGHHDARAADASIDAAVDATIVSDAPVPTAVLLRLANWSEDAPGLDFCLSPHGAGLWTGPVLRGSQGDVALGHLTVTDAGFSFDAGIVLRPHDAGLGAGDAAHLDATADSGDARAVVDGPVASDAAEGGADADAALAPTGVPFLRMSPYVSLSPGQYDVRLVASSAASCNTPLAPEVDDLPALVAGDVETLAAVGDTVDQGTDPSLGLSLLGDDSVVPAGKIALRFVNAIPSVIDVSFESGTLATATAVAYLASTQFGDVGADTDAGALDPNDYLITAPISDQVCSLVNANGGITTLIAVEGLSVPAGHLTTIVGVGGESGPRENAIGILVCLDTPPVVAGETASCDLYEAPPFGVCEGCE